MRLLLLLLGLLAALPTYAQSIRLHGAVTGGPDTLHVVVADLMLSSAQHAQHAVPARGFDVPIDADAPVWVLVRGAEHRLPPLLLEPGADVRLTADGPDWAQAVAADGPGAANVRYTLAHQPDDHWRAARRAAPQRLADGAGVEAVFGWVDSLRTVLDASVAVADVTPTFAVARQAENRAMATMIKWGALRGVEDAAEAERLWEGLVADLRAAEGGDTLAYAMRYTELLGDVLDQAYREAVTTHGGTPSTSGYYHFRKSASAHPSLQQVLLAEVLQSLLRTEDYDDEMARLVEDFARTAPDPRYHAYVQALAAREETLAPGQPAPAWTLETVEGDSLSLADLRGRVVVATVWGSWCSKSTRELPWLERVRADLAGEDVVFLNLAYDQAAPWRAAVAERGLGGVHALTTEAMRQAYGIVATPTLFLIGRDGTLLTKELPRPSEREGAALTAAVRAAL